MSSPSAPCTSAPRSSSRPSSRNWTRPCAATTGRWWAGYAVVGTGIYAPALFYWYRYLDRVMPGKLVAIAVRKALIDQLLASSTLLVAFYTAMSAMEGKEDIFAELKAKFVPTYKLSCCFWIPAQCINFFLVPPHLRVVTVGICSFAWVNILCIMKRMTVKASEEDT
ncbi:hypothetical protein MRX96_043319 [Rhipicephalus microplus]